MSAFTEHMDEQSPLLNKPSAFSVPGAQTTTATTSTSRPEAPSPTPGPQTASPAMSSTPTPSTTGDIKPSSDDPKATDPPRETGPPTRVGTNDPWSLPAGLPVRRANDENLLIFRRAVGINSDLSDALVLSTLEAGRKKAVGVYADVLRAKRRKAVSFRVLNTLLWLSYFLQVVVGAALTALGPGAADHPNLITGLGALNTVIAGLLALVKGQGLPERLRKDEQEFSRLQDWIEETEALLAVGIIGKDRKEVGLLVEMAFKRYNAARASEDNNRPDTYVSQTVEGQGGIAGVTTRGADGSVVTLNAPRI